MAENGIGRVVSYKKCLKVVWNICIGSRDINKFDLVHVLVEVPWGYIFRFICLEFMRLGGVIMFLLELEFFVGGGTH